MLRSIIFTTLGQLATGMLIFIALIPPSRIGKGFGRFHTALALALWLLATWGHFTPAFIALTVFLILACVFAGNNLSYYPFLVLSILGSFYVLMAGDISSIGTLPSLWIHIPPVLVLGASSVAMLLGHWYLVTPKLSITYLKVLTVGLLVAIGLRSALLLGTLHSHQAELSAGHFYEMYGIFFWQRIVLGLILTFVLSVMTYFCVRIRSTQSATGILYVVVVFCLVGELIGSYLSAKTGVLF
jgi:hypothetical protein